jgi:SAM-dependent methyltransferase
MDHGDGGRNPNTAPDGGIRNVSLTATLLEHALVYRMWQAPFAEQKFAPVQAHNDLKGVRKVLDVACGPGTNTRHFAHCDYLGIDLNRRYIENARARTKRDFLVADVCTYRVPSYERFDFILVNSFLHHLSNLDMANILSHLRALLAEDGHVHFLELVMPKEVSVARCFARWDRGKYARPQEEWEAIFCDFFDPVIVEPYPLVGLGTALWNMIYFKGKSQTSNALS